MDEYIFFIERLNSEEDEEIKLSSMPFIVSVIDNLCIFQMIRDLNFFFTSKDTNVEREYIFRIIAVKKDPKHINIQQSLSELLDYLKSTNNKFLIDTLHDHDNNNHNKFILVKQFKMKMGSNDLDDLDEGRHVKYTDEDLSCSFFKKMLKDNNYYYSNPQLTIDYIKLNELVNNR